MTNVEIGKAYICKPIGLEGEVVGYVERTYANTVMITVESCEQKDRPKVIECQHRMLVKYENIVAAGVA